MLLLLAIAAASDRITVDFSASQEHSCSQSWQSQGWHGQLWLEPGARRLGLAGSSTTVSGSQPRIGGSGAYEPPYTRKEALACEWEGTALPDGSWQMKLSSGGDYECRGEFTLACSRDGQRQRCMLGGQVPALLYLLGGGEEGLVLGEGLLIDADDYGMGSPHREIKRK